MKHSFRIWHKSQYKATYLPRPALMPRLITVIKNSNKAFPTYNLANSTTRPFLSIWKLQQYLTLLPMLSSSMLSPQYSLLTTCFVASLCASLPRNFCPLRLEPSVGNHWIWLDPQGLNWTPWILQILKSMPFPCEILYRMKMVAADTNSLTVY